jgi:hypothetical protein
MFSRHIHASFMFACGTTLDIWCGELGGYDTHPAQEG